MSESTLEVSGSRVCKPRPCGTAMKPFRGRVYEDRLLTSGTRPPHGNFSKLAGLMNRYRLSSSDAEIA